MYCKECGYENREDSKFCQNCGHKLRADSTSVTASNSAFNKDKSMVSKALNAMSSTADTTLKKIKEGSNSEELLRWHELFLRGVLTEEEFNEKKRALL